MAASQSVIMSCLKGHCHKDFVVSGQLCAKIINYFKALIINKKLLQSYDKDIK